MKSVLKKLLPHIIALIIFIALSAIYFYPAVFENKTLPQADVKNSIAWGMDLREYHSETGDYAFWSNSMFSGMPANYTYMPPTTNIFQILAKPLTLNASVNYGLVFLYMFGFYIFAMCIGGKNKHLLGIIGAVAYGFCTYNLVIIEAGHISKGLVMATMAPVLGGIMLMYRKKYIAGAIITLIFTGLNIMWSHQQITYYLLLMVAFLAISYLVDAIRKKTVADYFKSSAILVVVAVLAVAPSLGTLLPTMDYSKETMRGGAVLQQNAKGEKESSGLELDYAFRWSYGKAETFNLLIPNLYGGSSAYNIGDDSETYKALRQTGQARQFTQNAPMYWGTDPYKTFTSGPLYAGAIICFLFILGLFVIKGREKWWLLTATVFSFMLAWGLNFMWFNELVFKYLPLYNKFRTPETALVIANLAMIIMSVLVIKEITDNSRDLKKYLKPITLSAGITGGLALIFLVFGSAFFSFTGMQDANFPQWLQDALVADRKAMLRGDAGRSFFLILLAGGLIWFYAKKQFKTNWLLIGLAVLILFDFWTVDKRFLGKDNFIPKRNAREFVKTDIDNYILQDTSIYRVLNLAGSTFNESQTSAFHKSVGGYSPAKMRRYQDIIDYYFTSEIHPNILNMLNTKYIIFNTQQGERVQQNPDIYGNAWLVDSVAWVNSPDEEIRLIDSLDLKNAVVIDSQWKDKINITGITKTADKQIALANYKNPGNLIYEYTSNAPQFAVFSEVYYKTWHVYIDGQELPLARVNYILRGLPVPAGKHTIEFKCRDDVWLRASKISFAASWAIGILIVFGVAGVVYFRIRKK